MTTQDTEGREELYQRLKPFQQEHLLDFWNELSAARRARLASQIAGIDFAALATLRQGKAATSATSAAGERAMPPPAIRLQDCNEPSIREARERGVAAIRAGKVAALLVAGGQGTRLGFPHPKGMFKTGPVSGATLFQMFMEQVLAASRRYETRIPFFVMTSPATHAETVEYFAANNRFGLEEEDVHLFCQGVMPAVDAETGRVLLEAKDQIALSPDGHGGMLPALKSSGGLDELARRGVEYIHYFQVDNPLTYVCDPKFLGHHLIAKSEATTQVVAKRDPLQRVGNVAMIDGRMRIIEYIDLPESVARRTNTAGNLQLWAGNTGVHVFNVAFLRRCASTLAGLPFHLAHKAVPTIDAAGNAVSPTAPNAIKFERFIFDLLPEAERTLAVEADPAEAFAPIKNAPGAPKDSPEATREALLARARRWLAAAGAEVAPEIAVEISPLYALDAEICRERTAPGARFGAPTYLR